MLLHKRKKKKSSNIYSLLSVCGPPVLSFFFLFFSFFNDPFSSLLTSSPLSGGSPLRLLRLLALAFLLTLLELPEPARPRVPPLDHQTAFVCHHAALAGGVLVVPQQQVLLAGFDLGTLARHVFGPHPQELVAAADAALALLVDGDDVDGELPPLASFVRLQDVHLDGVILFAVLLHVDLQFAFGRFAIGVAI